jgi:hypothetical protein
VTDQAGCFSQITKTINPGPVFTVELAQTFLAATQEVVLSSSVTGGAGSLQYLWNTGSINDSLITDSNGVYVLSVTDGQNCVAKDTIVVTQFVGIRENLSSGYFSLHPNPLEGKVWIETEMLTEPASVHLSNALGQPVWFDEIQAGASTIRLDLSGWKKGVYIVSLKTRSGIRRQTILVH